MFAAAEIYTMIRDYPHRVTVKIASIAASAASVIAMAGNTVEMSPTALLFVHDPSTIAMGNTRDMEKAITTVGIKKFSDKHCKTGTASYIFMKIQIISSACFLVFFMV